MKSLAEQNCQKCSEGDPHLTRFQLNSYMENLDGWDIVIIESIQRLTKQFTFKNFADALMFTNAVGALAEAEDHHPTLVTEWGKVQVTWWTHTLDNVHHNDFILAARTDALLAPA